MNPNHPHKKRLRLFVSVPMSEKTDEEIKTYIDELYFKVKNLPQYKDCIVMLLNSFVNEDAPICSNVPVWYLAKSVEVLCKADIVCFGRNWELYRGCNIEHLIATSYEIPIVYDDTPKEEDWNIPGL